MNNPTEMKPKDSQELPPEVTNPNNVKLICPFCGQDPLTITMRFSPIPPPPSPPKLVMIYHGCSNVKCRRVITAQIVPHDWLLYDVPQIPDARDNRKRIIS